MTQPRAGGSVSYPAFPARRGGVPVTTWWARSWSRTLEEASYGEGELKAGRALARRGAVGAIELSPGRYLAPVLDDDDAFTVQTGVEPLSEPDQQVVAEVLASGTRRLTALRTGDLPLEFVEALEEAGVELLPYEGELRWSCTCRPWTDPCAHSLAVGVQVGWLMQADPWVLLQLRGMPREDLLARVQPSDDADVRVALAAAEQARALLDAWEEHDSDAQSGAGEG